MNFNLLALLIKVICIIVLLFFVWLLLEHYKRGLKSIFYDYVKLDCPSYKHLNLVFYGLVIIFIVTYLGGIF